MRALCGGAPLTQPDSTHAHSGAGTDANVYIELHGDKGFIGKTNLDNAANSELCAHRSESQRDQAQAHGARSARAYRQAVAGF